MPAINSSKNSKLCSIAMLISPRLLGPLRHDSVQTTFENATVGCNTEKISAASRSHILLRVKIGSFPQRCLSAVMEPRQRVSDHLAFVDAASFRGVDRELGLHEVEIAYGAIGASSSSFRCTLVDLSWSSQLQQRLQTPSCAGKVELLRAAGKRPEDYVMRVYDSLYKLAKGSGMSMLLCPQGGELHVCYLKVGVCGTLVFACDNTCKGIPASPHLYNHPGALLQSGHAWRTSRPCLTAGPPLTSWQVGVVMNTGGYMDTRRWLQCLHSCSSNGGPGRCLKPAHNCLCGGSRPCSGP